MDTQEKLIDLFNAFVKAWCGRDAAHLLDSDHNQGEQMREAIKLCLEEQFLKGKVEGMTEARDIFRSKLK